MERLPIEIVKLVVDELQTSTTGERDLLSLGATCHFLRDAVRPRAWQSYLLRMQICDRAKIERRLAALQSASNPLRQHCSSLIVHLEPNADALIPGNDVAVLDELTAQVVAELPVLHTIEWVSHPPVTQWPMTVKAFTNLAHLRSLSLVGIFEIDLSGCSFPCVRDFRMVNYAQASKIDLACFPMLQHLSLVLFDTSDNSSYSGLCFGSKTFATLKELTFDGVWQMEHVELLLDRLAESIEACDIVSLRKARFVVSTTRPHLLRLFEILSCAPLTHLDVTTQFCVRSQDFALITNQFPFLEALGVWIYNGNHLHVWPHSSHEYARELEGLANLKSVGMNVRTTFNDLPHAADAEIAMGPKTPLFGGMSASSATSSMTQYVAAFGAAIPTLAEFRFGDDEYSPIITLDRDARSGAVVRMKREGDHFQTS